MNVVSFVLSTFATLAQVVTAEPVAWGAALLVLALLFRLFWRLATSQN